MRRLKHQQEVEIHLDGPDEVILDCRVQGVERSVATLASVDSDPSMLLVSSVPAVPGYLVFDHSGGRQVKVISSMLGVLGSAISTAASRAFTYGVSTRPDSAVE